MSNTIDEKVVEMRFDNDRFEENVSESLSTLDKLKESLKFTGATKGLESIEDAAKNCKFSGLNSAIETVQMKFSALEVIAVTTLNNITNSAINASKKIVSALTIDPVKTGFQEYETQINAVQTILANTSSKGTTLDQVNAALDELNHYADMTIYNFTEMTRNIGTFTAAGVDLDTSVAAIKGIANLAAVSGSTSQQASTAMYQLSQALAAGTVKLMDWNSVVNAGMGGQVFQDALKETARVHGIAIDSMIESEGSFRETLKNGWLTSEVLTETLSKFTGDLNEEQLKTMGYTDEQIASIIEMGKTANDAATKVKTFTQLFDTLKEAAQSGWTQSWETIVGDFEEAKELLTDISDTFGGLINASAEARNAVLSEGLSSGWKQFLSQGIEDSEGYKDSIIAVAKEHGIAIDEMIASDGSFEKTLKRGWITSDILSESLSKLADKTRGLSDEEIKALGYTREQVNSLEAMEQAIKDGSISLDDFSEKIGRLSGRDQLIEALKNAFDGIVDVVTPVKEAFREVFPPMTGEKLYEFTERIEELTEKFKMSDATSNNLKNTFKGLFSVLDMGKQAASALLQGAGPLLTVFGKMAGCILSLTGNFGKWLTQLNETIKEQGLLANSAKKLEVITVMADRICERFNNIKESTSTLRSFISSIAELIISGLDKAGNAVGNFVSLVLDKLSDIKFNDAIDAINSAFIGGIALTIYNFVKTVKKTFIGLKDTLGNIPQILDGVRGSLEAYQTNLKAGTLLKIAGAVALLAGAFTLLSLVNSDKLMLLWKAAFENNNSKWSEEQQDDFETWSTTQKANFNAWFAGIQEEFSGDVAASLSLRIDKLTYKQTTTTTFNANGTITEETDDYVLTTTFNDDGTITEVYTYTNGIVKTATTSFGETDVKVTVV